MIFSEHDAFLDIAVLAGGDSSEREVSLASGCCVAEALRERGHHVDVFDPTEVDLFSLNWRQFDACLVALHGGAGEDGRVQVHLEELGVPYTSSEPVASRLAMSKSAAKERFRQRGVPTPPSVNLKRSAPVTDTIVRIAALGYPLVVKPNGQGSSLGVCVARNPGEIGDCLRRAGEYEGFLLAEPMLAGREFTVAVLDREPLPPLEVIHDGDLFDYRAKYQCDAVKIFPATDDQAELAKAIAVDAAAALCTRGLVRVDLVLDDDDQPQVLEVNTVPGMTRTSLVPMAATAAGIDFAELCDRLVRRCVLEEVYA